MPKTEPGTKTVGRIDGLVEGRPIAGKLVYLLTNDLREEQVRQSLLVDTPGSKCVVRLEDFSGLGIGAYSQQRVHRVPWISTLAVLKLSEQRLQVVALVLPASPSPPRARHDIQNGLYLCKW